MPARGYRGSCRYPWPHAGIWFAMYHYALASHQRVPHLDIEDAMMQHDILNATADIEFEYRIRRDPELGARKEQVQDWRPVAGFPMRSPTRR
jgi:hypothetical protein